MAAEEVGIGELSRQVRDVLLRFEGLATRLETQFVRNDNFALYKQLVDVELAKLLDVVKTLATVERIASLEEQVKKMASKDEVKPLAEKVADLEDDKKWLVRLVIGFIILGVLGALFAVSKAGGASG